VTTIVLLTVSNIFMTFAWYGHLKFKSADLVVGFVLIVGAAFFVFHKW